MLTCKQSKMSKMSAVDLSCGIKISYYLRRYCLCIIICSVIFSRRRV